LSVTANFLRPQNGAKKETPPGGARFKKTFNVLKEKSVVIV